MSFTTAYEKWYQDHLERRSGERKDRLKRGLGHGEKVFLEKVWWPLFGHFDGLHPEYEVADWRNMNYFVDLMWRMGSVSIAFEIKGYGPHVQQTDRTRYRRELNREMFLQGLGFQVVSIPYDELAENAELVKFFVQMIIAPYLGHGEEHNTLFSRLERDIMRLAMRIGRVIRPADVVRELEIDQKTAIKYLRQLTDKGKFRAVSSGQSGRVRRYEYVGSFLDIGRR